MAYQHRSKDADQEASYFALIERLDGLFVGQLSEEELKAFRRCVKAKKAEVIYPNFLSAALGLGKVRIIYE